MAAYKNNFWKQAPFVKILIAVAAGIVLQWNIQLQPGSWWWVFAAGIFLFTCFFFIPFFEKYRYAFFNGLLVMVLFVSIGGLLAWKKDIRNNNEWIGNHYSPGDGIIVTIDEPLTEKTKSFKTIGQANYLVADENTIAIKGKIIIYIKKDSAVNLRYGDKIFLKKPLQEIKNSGNPGGFDYKRYSLFQGITHQVYLKPEDYVVLNDKNINSFRQFIYSSRENVLGILRKYIHGDRELGLAEALLIGYKNDLEQSLVQSYTNTGVVHIIAISGLHLGLIYWLLGLIVKPLKNKKKLRWIRPVFIITGLWMFSFLAGAQPSILRSALMFTCIILGDSFSRKTSIYNTIALSAFILLCINPYWLWDVGFQLSYAAVLSIIIFMRPVYNLFYVKNKALDFIWKMNAVTLAAQILTVPLGIYHFHQFPNLFLLTNFVAVPLSSLILLGEILLCVISFIPFVAALIGKLLWGMIWLMNTYIEKIESIRFSLWDGLQISIPQAIFFTLFAVGISYWLMEKSAKGLKWGLLSLLAFAALRSFSFTQSNRQQKIVVYNVPQKSAIDFIDGRNYQFVGDSDLLENDFARNFHLKPSRVLFRIDDKEKPTSLVVNNNYINYHNKKILLADTAIRFETQSTKPEIDLLVISKNPRLYIKEITKAINIKQVVFDGSVPAWKTTYWKKDCDSLHIPWHDVSTKGAFVMRVD
jgi:competence protein ComEC